MFIKEFGLVVGQTSEEVETEEGIKERETFFTNKRKGSKCNVKFQRLNVFDNG